MTAVVYTTYTECLRSSLLFSQPSTQLLQTSPCTETPSTLFSQPWSRKWGMKRCQWRDITNRCLSGWVARDSKVRLRFNGNFLLLQGYGRTAETQAGYQLLGIGSTIAFAIVGGLITGLFLRSPSVRRLDQDKLHDDEDAWEVPAWGVTQFHLFFWSITVCVQILFFRCLLVVCPSVDNELNKQNSMVQFVRLAPAGLLKRIDRLRILKIVSAGAQAEEVDWISQLLLANWTHF